MRTWQVLTVTPLRLCSIQIPIIPPSAALLRRPLRIPEIANQVTLTGFNFQSGSQVNLTNGTLSIPGTVSSLSSTDNSLLFPTNRGTHPDLYTVNMLTPGGTTGSLTGTFTVTNETPTISSTINSSGCRFQFRPPSGDDIREQHSEMGCLLLLVNGSTVTSRNRH